MKNNIVQDSTKNLLGTVIYFFCLWLMLIIVIRFAGYKVSGEFSLVISFSNVFGFISMYNLRNFQLSDIEHQFSPAQYTGAYVLTSGLAFLCFIIAILFCGYTSYLIICCFIYFIFKLLETFSFYFFTYMQLNNKYMNIFISYCLKGIIPVIGFSLFLYFGFHLLLSLCILAFLYLLIILIYDIRIIKDVLPNKIVFKNTYNILKQCFPLMVSTLILPLMLFLTRHTISKIYGITELGFYSAMTMVIVVISTMVGSIYVVLLPVISKNYIDNKKKDNIRIILSTIAIIIIAAIIAIVLAKFIGDYIFTIVFGNEILPYMYLLTPAIIAGSVLTIMSFFSMYLIAVHKRMQMLISLITGLLVLSIFIMPLTQSHGMLGNINLLTLSFTISIAMQCIFSIKTIVNKKTN